MMKNNDAVIAIIWFIVLYYKHWHKPKYNYLNVSNILSPIPTLTHNILTFDRKYRFMWTELLIDFLIIIPLFATLSFLIKRLAIRYNIGNLISKLSLLWNQKPKITTNDNVQRERNKQNHENRNMYDHWKIRIHHIECGSVYLYASEIFIDLWISSVSCISNMVDETGNVTISERDVWNRYGCFCPSKFRTTIEFDNRDSTKWDSQLLTLILLIRFVFILMGVYIGQSMVVIALTGSIASGKSTVGNMLLRPKTFDCGKQNIFTVLVNNIRRIIVYDSVRIIDSDRIGHELLLPPAILSSREKLHVASNDIITSAVRGTYTFNNYPYSITAKDSVYDDLIRIFGDKNILVDDDKSKLIDRRKLGSIIFQDPIQRRKLNQMTHPRIIRILIQQILYGAVFGLEKIVCIDIPLLFETNSIMQHFSGLIITVACTNPSIQYERLHKRNPDLTKQQCLERISSQSPMDYKIRMSDIIVWNEEHTSLPDLQRQVDMIRYDLSKRLYGIFQCFTMFHCTLLLGFAIMTLHS